MFLGFYRTYAVEDEIAVTYQRYGITQPCQMQLWRIAEAFDIELRFYEGRSFVYYGDGQPVIFIDSRLSEIEQREDFFHELCHPLRHEGCQTKMPRLFKELQEIQAAQFQLYAALPFFLIKQVYDDIVNVSAKYLASLFQLSEALVHRRIEQIKARMTYLGKEGA